MQPSAPGYRNAPPRCAGCGSVMEERGPANARIDVCRACGGVWLDWFDGEATALARAVERRLFTGEQAILFLNRRGFAPYVFCRDCGVPFRCEDCDVSLTLHRGRDVLMCRFLSLNLPR